MDSSSLFNFTFPVQTFAGGLAEPAAAPRAPVQQALADLPDVFSLSTIVPRPMDQGRRGTCATFAMCAAAEVVNNRDLSEQHLYFQAWNEVYSGNPGSADEGTSLDAVGKILTTQGVCADEAWSYNRDAIDGNPSQGPPPVRLGTAERFRVRSVAVAAPPNPASLAICEYLYRDRRPVILSVPVLDNAGWESGFVIDLPTGASSIHGWHAIVAVGFNRSASLLIIKNSWGPYWAMFGYAAMTFAYVDQYTRSIARME